MSLFCWNYDSVAVTRLIANHKRPAGRFSDSWLSRSWEKVGCWSRRLDSSPDQKSTGRPMIPLRARLPTADEQASPAHAWSKLTDGPYLSEIQVLPAPALVLCVTLAILASHQPYCLAPGMPASHLTY